MVSSSATLAFLSAAAFITGKGFGQPVKYDQRQEGDLNVRTDVEDVVLVVVPPQDLVAAGMGLVAATAADFLKKNYGAIGPERWPHRTSTKAGFAPLEKSPYKVDLEKSGAHVKKISQAGDPNRYNFQENKNPTKVALVASTTSRPTELPSSKPTTSEVTVEEMSSTTTATKTTESKTVKKDLKTEEMKKGMAETKKAEEKMTHTQEKMTEVKEKMKEEKAPELQKMEDAKKMGEKQKVGEEKESEEKKKKSESTKGKTEMMEKMEEKVRVIADSLDPSSIFRHEDCGPDAFRDSNGICVFKDTETTSS